MIAPQGLEIGEKVVCKYEETHHTFNQRGPNKLLPNLKSLLKTLPTPYLYLIFYVLRSWWLYDSTAFTSQPSRNPGAVAAEPTAAITAS